MIRSECPEGMIYDSICAYADKNEGSQEDRGRRRSCAQKKDSVTFLEQLHDDPGYGDVYTDP